MADATVNANISNQIGRGTRGLVFSSALIGYAFFIEAGNTFVYSKTSDGGATWGVQVTISSDGVSQGYDVWFDQWTPGNSGTLIHIWCFGSTSDNVSWRTLDTNGDTLGTPVTIFDGASTSGAYGTMVSGTKTSSGYLYCSYNIDAGTEFGFKRSTDSGATWSSDLGGSFNEGSNDAYKLFPATGTGDGNDCWAIYSDTSASELTMKMWDSSAAAQIESSSMQTVTVNTTDLTGQYGIGGSVRLSDGHLIVVSSSERDTATSDMQVWDVSAVNSGSQTGITAKTNITTDKDDIYYPSPFVDSYGNIYVAYNGKRDGSETLGSATKVYYTKSTDGGTTWSAGDTTYMDGTAANIVQVWTPSSGSIFYVIWNNVSVSQLFGNAVNSVVPAAPIVGLYTI